MIMSGNRVNRLGFWSAVALIVLEVVYIAALAFEFGTQGFAFPPAPFVQTIAGVITILTGPVMIVLFAAIKYRFAEEDAILGSLGLTFATLLVAMISINRFVQLTVIRTAPAAALTGDLARFLPYASGSVMLALEELGWGFFLSLAALAVAPLFRGDRLQISIRWVLVAIAVLSFMGLTGYATASLLSLFGFIAWGPLLMVLGILLALFFRRPEYSSSSS